MLSRGDMRLNPGVGDFVVRTIELTCERPSDSSSRLRDLVAAVYDEVPEVFSWGSLGWEAPAQLTSVTGQIEVDKAHRDPLSVLVAREPPALDIHVVIRADPPVRLADGSVLVIAAAPRTRTVIGIGLRLRFTDPASVTELPDGRVQLDGRFAVRRSGEDFICSPSGAQ